MWFPPKALGVPKALFFCTPASVMVDISAEFLGAQISEIEPECGPNRQVGLIKIILRLDRTIVHRSRTQT
jgi:hypothetical protein